MVALVQASNTLPIMVFSLIAGAVADSYDRRRIMLAAQLFMFCVSVALTVFAFFEGLNAWLLLTFTFLIGCGQAFNNPAWQASVRDFVGKDLLSAAVLLRMSVTLRPAMTRLAPSSFHSDCAPNAWKRNPAASTSTISWRPAPI